MHELQLMLPPLNKSPESNPHAVLTNKCQNNPKFPLLLQSLLANMRQTQQCLTKLTLNNYRSPPYLTHNCTHAQTRTLPLSYGPTCTTIYLNHHQRTLIATYHDEATPPMVYNQTIGSPTLPSPLNSRKQFLFLLPFLSVSSWA